MEGLLSMIQFSPFPFTPGFDVSGVVVKTGPNCKDFQVNDEVFAMVNFKTCGTFAEYVACDSKYVSKKVCIFLSSYSRLIHLSSRRIYPMPRRPQFHWRH